MSRCHGPCSSGGGRPSGTPAWRTAGSAGLSAWQRANRAWGRPGWVYGSVARGTSGPASDVDVGLLLGRRPERTLQAFPFDLQHALGRLVGREVQVVVLDDAAPDLVHRVLRDGRLVFEGDPSARIAFQVRSRNEYFDLLPVLEEYRRPRRTKTGSGTVSRQGPGVDATREPGNGA